MYSQEHNWISLLLRIIVCFCSFGVRHFCASVEYSRRFELTFRYSNETMDRGFRDGGMNRSGNFGREREVSSGMSRSGNYGREQERFDHRDSR